MPEDRGKQIACESIQHCQGHPNKTHSQHPSPALIQMSQAKKEEGKNGCPDERDEETENGYMVDHIPGKKTAKYDLFPDARIDADSHPHQALRRGTRQSQPKPL